MSSFIARIEEDEHSRDTEMYENEFCHYPCFLSCCIKQRNEHCCVCVVEADRSHSLRHVLQSILLVDKSGTKISYFIIASRKISLEIYSSVLR